MAFSLNLTPFADITQTRKVKPLQKGSENHSSILQSHSCRAILKGVFTNPDLHSLNRRPKH